MTKPILCPECGHDIDRHDKDRVFGWGCEHRCPCTLAPSDIASALLAAEPCICDRNPETTNGPDEECPQHGRPYSYWVQVSEEFARRLYSEPTEDEVERAAKAMYGRDPVAGYEWSQVPLHWAEDYRADARAALRATRGLA